MDPDNTYFMAIGFDGACFGIQTKTDTERWINYSVWDGKGAPKPIERGPRVISQSFYHEGSGMQTYRRYHWETAVPNRFMVTVENSKRGHAMFSGFFLIKSKWYLMASIERPGHSPYLTGLNSFLENFGVGNSKMRKARYSNVVYQVQGSEEWHPINEAETSNAPPTNSDDSWMHTVDSEGFVMEIDGKTETKTTSKIIKLNSTSIGGQQRPVIVQEPFVRNVLVVYCFQTLIINKTDTDEAGENEWHFWSGVQHTNNFADLINYPVPSQVRESNPVTKIIHHCNESIMSSEDAAKITLFADGYEDDFWFNDKLGKGFKDVTWDGDFTKGPEEGQFDGGNSNYKYTRGVYFAVPRHQVCKKVSLHAHTGETQIYYDRQVSEIE
jgi:hypothetical protein